MATLSEILKAQPRPTLKNCPECGKEYFLYHPDGECQSVKDSSKNNHKDKKKEEKKNGKHKR